MERLNFSCNWNRKLDCDVFSTIRLWNPPKHFEGKQVEVYDNSVSPARYKGRAVYVIVSEFTLRQLKPAAAMLDTGYDLEQTKSIIRTMYNKKVPNVETQPFAYCILQKIKEKNTQNTLGL